MLQVTHYPGASLYEPPAFESFPARQKAGGRPPAATGKLPASRASAALGTHPARRVEGGGGRQGAAQRGLIAHAPLQSGATTLGYCSKGRLLLVGCHDGHLYALCARSGAAAASWGSPL